MGGKEGNFSNKYDPSWDLSEASLERAFSEMLPQATKPPKRKDALFYSGRNKKAWRSRKRMKAARESLARE